MCQSDLIDCAVIVQSQQEMLVTQNRRHLEALIVNLLDQSYWPTSREANTSRSKLGLFPRLTCLSVCKGTSYFIYYGTCVYHEDNMLPPCDTALNVLALQGEIAQSIGDIRGGSLAVMVKLQHWIQKGA